MWYFYVESSGYFEHSVKELTGYLIYLLEEKTNNMHLLYLPLFISTCWLLHVSAVACHHQGAYWILLSYVKYKLRGGISYNVCLRGLCAGLSWFHVLYIPAHNTRNHDNPFVFHGTQEDPISSLMTAGYCRNM
jgi:hypothetical protein